MKNYDLKQSGAEVQELLDQVPMNKAEIERLKQLYAGLSKTDVEIVAALPEVGVANTIYRVTGSDGYADYMFDADDLSTAILLATYGNGIDEEPVAGSENLVRSGGVFKTVSKLLNGNNIYFYFSEEDNITVFNYWYQEVEEIYTKEGIEDVVNVIREYINTKNTESSLRDRNYNNVFLYCSYEERDTITFTNYWFETVEQVYNKDAVNQMVAIIPNLKEIFEYTCEKDEGKIVFFNHWYQEVSSTYTTKKLNNYLDFIYNICLPDNEDSYLYTYWYESSSDHKKDLDIDFPTYLFMCDMGNSNTGNEYIASIYPEACAKSYITDLRIGGNKKGLIQRIKSSNLTEPTISETKSFIFSAKEYSDKNINVNVVFSNRYNAQNKNIELLCIGDSITEQSPSLGEISGSWVCNIGKFAAVDDISIGDIKVNLIGTRNIYSKSVSFNSQTRTVVNNSEGRSGWATYTYLNWPVWTRLDGPSSIHHFIGRKAMFYALGLSTKTPYNSSTPSQTAVSYNSIYNEEIAKTPFGRYKIDCNEVLWEEMKSCYTDFPGTGEYSPATSNTIIQQYWELKCNNPDNVFYDIDKARAYTGDYVWTYDNAFSINKYLERYRTCDDHGNTLVGSAGETVIGEDGGTYVIGSKVTNTGSFKVCKPTHIISALGTNDFSYITDEGSAELQDMLHTAIKESAQEVIIGYWLPRRPGVLNIQEWQKYGYQKLISSLEYKKNIFFKKLNPLLSLSNKATYIPAFYTASPLGASTNRVVYDLDDIAETYKIISGSDSVHPSAVSHRSIGYQCLAWLYWTLQ